MLFARKEDVYRTGKVGVTCKFASRGDLGYILQIIWFFLLVIVVESSRKALQSIYLRLVSASAQLFQGYTEPPSNARSRREFTTVRGISSNSSALVKSYRNN
jgi:hypothetical protein